VQVRGEGGVGVGASVDRAIIVVVLWDCDPLGSGELLFPVTDNGLLLLPREVGGALAHPCLIQCLACGSHSSDSGLSHGRDGVLLPLSGGGGGLLLINREVGGAAQHDR
jgi:hypothetical protein